MKIFKITVKVKDQRDSQFDEIKTYAVDAKSEKAAAEKVINVAMALTSLANPSHAVVLEVK